MTILDLNFGAITKAYSGQTRCCACGCKGNYFTANQKAAQRSNASAQRIFNKMRRTDQTVRYLNGLGEDEGIFTTTIGKRDYTLYFLKSRLPFGGRQLTFEENKEPRLMMA